MLLLFAISFNSFNHRFIILICWAKSFFYVTACFWCVWSDHIFYCRPKLIIFQHNGLGFLSGIVVVTIIVIMIVIIVIIAVLITIIMIFIIVFVVFIIVVIIYFIFVTESLFEVEFYPELWSFYRTNFL